MKALAAIVFTDVAGFSQRSQKDEATTLASLRRDISVMASICDRFNGVILKTLGDGVLMRFSSAQSALDAAIEIQVTLFRQSRVLRVNEILEHRIGIHLGDVIITNDDVMGDGVNIAARLQALAKPGAICMSRTVYDVAKANPKLQAKYLGPRTLKGIKDPVMVWEIPPIKDIAREKREETLEAFSVPIHKDPDGATGIRAALLLGVLALVLIGGAITVIFVFKNSERAEKAARSKPEVARKGPTLLDRLTKDIGTSSNATGQNQAGASGASSSGAKDSSPSTIADSTPSPTLLASLKPLFDACQFKEMAQAVRAAPFGQTLSGAKMADDDDAIALVFIWLKEALSKTSATAPILVSGLPNTSQPIQVYQDQTGKVVLNLPGSPASSDLAELPKAAIAAIATSAATDPATQQNVPDNLQLSLKAMTNQSGLFNEN